MIFYIIDLIRISNGEAPLCEVLFYINSIFIVCTPPILMIYFVYRLFNKHFNSSKDLNDTEFKVKPPDLNNIPYLSHISPDLYSNVSEIYSYRGAQQYNKKTYNVRIISSMHDIIGKPLSKEYVGSLFYCTNTKKIYIISSIDLNTGYVHYVEVAREPYDIPESININTKV